MDKLKQKKTWLRVCMIAIQYNNNVKMLNENICLRINRVIISLKKIIYVSIQLGLKLIKLKLVNDFAVYFLQKRHLFFRGANSMCVCVYECGCEIA